MGKPSDLVQGTWTFSSSKRSRSWVIAKRIRQVSGEVLQGQQGALYAALHRLEQQAWIKVKWMESGTGRQAKFYSLTAADLGQLRKEAANWARLSSAIDLTAAEA